MLFLFYLGREMYFTRTAISHKGKWKFYSELEGVYPDNYTHLLMPFSAFAEIHVKGHVIE